MRILLIEDNPADARLFSKIMTETDGPRHFITHTQTITECLTVLKHEVFDAAFIDLNLPDSSGLETLHTVLGCKPEMPIIILTGMDNDDLGSQAIQEGAQDFIPKDVISPSTLTRSLRHSIERKKLLLELHQKAQQAQQELQELRKIVQTPTTSGSKNTDSSAQTPVSSQLHELVSAYSEILGLAVSEQIHNTKSQHTDLLNKLIQRLGGLNAMPKDIIQIHLLAIDEIIKHKNALPKSAYIEEGRMLLLETMGELACYYHQVCVAGSGH